MLQTWDWSEHVAGIWETSLKRIDAWESVHYKLYRKHLEICMSLFAFLILNYGNYLYDNCSELDKFKLENVLLAAARVVDGGKRGTSHDLLRQETGWTPLHRNREVHKLCKSDDIVNGHTPPYLLKHLPRDLNASCGVIYEELKPLLHERMQLFENHFLYLGLIYTIGY